MIETVTIAMIMNARRKFLTVTGMLYNSLSIDRSNHWSKCIPPIVALCDFQRSIYQVLRLLAEDDDDLLVGNPHTLCCCKDIKLQCLASLARSRS